MEIEIRYGQEKDLPALVEIYNHYILNSNCTFDTKITSVQEKEEWFSKYSPSGPYRLLVAENDNEILGCSYSGRYRTHPSFDKTIEVSVYLNHKKHGQGIGSKLYAYLFEVLANEDLHLAVAGIALPNDASVGLHKKFGFEEVGIFKEYALKNDRYISSIWLQKPLRSKFN